MADRSVFEALDNIVAFWPGDWSSDERLAWLYGIIAGWDDEDDEDAKSDDTMSSVATRHKWDTEAVERLRKQRREYKALSGLQARVAELEDERLALDTCWRCKVALEKVGSPESRVPRCTECPEPESMDDVDQRGEGS